MKPVIIDDVERFFGTQLRDAQKEYETRMDEAGSPVPILYAVKRVKESLARYEVFAANTTVLPLAETETEMSGAGTDMPLHERVKIYLKYRASKAGERYEKAKTLVEALKRKDFLPVRDELEASVDALKELSRWNDYRSQYEFEKALLEYVKTQI